MMMMMTYYAAKSMPPQLSHILGSGGKALLFALFPGGVGTAAICRVLSHVLAPNSPKRCKLHIVQHCVNTPLSKRLRPSAAVPFFVVCLF